MAVETNPAQKTGRSYTRARRMPWVVGKIQGVTLPFGPYSATQLAVLLGGGWLLVQTFRIWSCLGPAGLLLLALPPAAAWAVRHAKIEGRSPARALAGYLALLTEPSCGRIAGRLASDRRPVTLTGQIRIATQPEPAQLPAPTALQALLAASTAPTGTR
jgi:hypothetical protein